ECSPGFGCFFQNGLEVPGIPMLEDDRKPTISLEHFDRKAHASPQSLDVMLLSKAKLSTHNYFVFSRGQRNLKTKPVVPENRQVEIGYVAPIRRVGEDVIDLAPKCRWKGGNVQAVRSEASSPALGPLQKLLLL